MAARVLFQVAASGQPGWRPVLAIRVVAQVNVAPAHVERDIVIAAPGNAAQTRIAVKGISARGIRDDAEVPLAPQIVDPWQRSIRPRYDILPILIVEIAVFHRMLWSPYCLSRSIIS